MKPNPSQINIHIDRIVLDGISLSSSRQPQFRAAVESELQQLFIEKGITGGLQDGGELPQVSGGDIQVSGESNPNHLGQQVAHAAYKGISS